MKKILFVFFFLMTAMLWSQRTGQKERPESLRKMDTAKEKKAPINLYKIITSENDTTYVDTTLTILKDYKFNYLRKDNFELLPFSNTGQTYNSLSYQKDYEETFPKFGARARHFNFMEAEDINYYYVPTPFTELYFKTVPEQGQQLDAFFTVNTTPNLNFSIAYKGTRALGKYQHILTSTGNLRMTINYSSDSNRYYAKAHFVSQDLLNEENGGLTEQAIQQYINKEPEFEDRSVLAVNFENAESTLFGKRFYIDHEFVLNNPLDSINRLSIGHILNYNYEKFVFTQSAAEKGIFGESFESSNLNDKTRMEKLLNELSLNYSNRTLGKLSFMAGYTGYKYGYNSVYIKPGDTIGNKLTGDIIHIGGNFKKQIGGFGLEASAQLHVTGDFPGNFLEASAFYEYDRNNYLRFGINQNSRKPNFNFLLYQSDYINYNWQNSFNNEIAQRLFGDFHSEKFGNLFGSLSQIQNYTYFTENDLGNVKPFQADGQVRYLKIKAEKGLDFGVFGIYNTLMYQNVLQGTDVLNLPEIVTRNSIYYKDYWFNKALYLQTGFTFKYFSKYQMDAYNPVLAEFYVQNEQELGGYPVVDFFFNAKIDQARIFFKLQHLNDLIQGNNNFTAPGYPYTDFLIRFGLVWDFFL
ncbi:hypothetical protein C7S20_02810 [Christiangramia fulva]|uniref:Porin n=1 Tax=Christiangramia fulva TaxID=2126553 RepID=A0A2R3Z200_9FLAO|nr:putative porin [Christiangramia fulva]AVR44272.1 hypothetical protein C7S20_02810 [Christiangramia fulva]